MIRNRKFSSVPIILALLLVSSVILPASTKALDSPAITVTPGVVNIELTEANQTVESEIEINSNYSEATTLKTSLSGVDDSTGILVGNGTSVEESLEKSISLSSSQVTVPANGKVAVTIKVNNSDLLSPGGHYAAITLSQVSDVTSQVNLQSTISISVFIVKRGGEKVSVSIKDEVLKISRFKLPSKAVLTYINSGNVLITPRASVTIRSLDGSKVYAKGVSNESSLNILPGKILEDTFSIKKIASLPKLPTKLKYITEYRADGVSNSQYKELQSWYIPPIFIVFSSLFTIIAVLIFVRLTKKLLKKFKRPKKKVSVPRKTTGGLISDITPAPKKQKKDSEKTD